MTEDIVKYSLPDEFQFYEKMLSCLDGVKYEIFKSKSKFCTVDFMVFEKYNLKTVYVEHKRRFINQHNYNTLLISKQKIDKMVKNYRDSSFIIW